MDVFEAVRTALAVRQFQPRPVPPEVVRQIVDAARLTGSSMNRQPWHFVVVERPEPRRVGIMLVREADRQPVFPQRLARGRARADARQ